MKVLLIEDHPIVRAGCFRVLAERADLHVIEAETAAQGLNLARGFAPDIVILDLNLPDGRGLDLLKTMKAERPETKVVVFTMYEELAFVSSAMDAGASPWPS
jgi:two-component system invasion response regulator UvrY